jgi:dTDP-4-amino-4,6-dideoxygalactose transaminase
MNVPLFEPWISKKDIKQMISVLKKPQLTDGPILRKLELEFSKFVGSKYAIGVSNGTSALQLSLMSIGINNGDEVIIPDMTFVATANAVINCGAKPILADIDHTMNISAQSIEKVITKKTKAVIPVHFAGFSCEMDQILEISKRKKIDIVEDCAHSLGTYYKKKHVGTLGKTGCFSFYPTKNITSIEGGMVITNSQKIAQKVESLRNHGLTKDLLQRNVNTKPWVYDIKKPGYNYRLDELRSSLAMSQLFRINDIAKRRINAAKYYAEKLKDQKGIEIVNLKNIDHHVFHLFIIRIKNGFGISRDQVHEKLFKKGIKTTVHYKPLHLFSYLKERKGNKKFYNSTNAYKECITLPLFPTITKKQQDYVIHTLLQLQK